MVGIRGLCTSIYLRNYWKDKNNCHKKPWRIVFFADGTKTILKWGKKTAFFQILGGKSVIFNTIY